MTGAQTLLLVEDEAIISLREAMMLRKAGYQVQAVYSGEEAVACIRAGSPRIDLILMDINLGRGMDGTQAAQEILKETNIPIIFLSSHTEPDVVEKTEKITSYGYVVKDTGSTVLTASIKMAFKLHEAHQALRRTNEMLSLSLESSRAGTWDWDIASNHFVWSPEFKHVFGMPASVVAGFESWLAVLHPEDRQQAQHRVQEAIQQKIDLLNDYRVVLPGGEIRWIRATGKTYYDGERPLRMAGLCMDITERKQVERALAHSHDLMRYVIEHSRSAIAVHDRDLRYIYVSQRYLQEYDVKEKNIIGKHHYEVFPDLPQKWRDVHQQALRGIVSAGENDPYLRDNGSLEWTRWECRPWYEADGSIGGIIVYTEVTTEHKRIENTLKRSESRLREAQRIAGLGDWEWDARTDQVTWSKEMYALALLDENLPAPTYAEHPRFYSPASMQRLSAAVEQTMRTGQPYELDLELVRTDGSTRWVMARGEAVFDASQHVAGLRGTVYDISERQQAELLRGETTQRFLNLTANLPIFVAFINASSLRYEYVNPAYEKAFGIPHDQIIGLSIRDVIGEPNYQYALPYLNEVRQGKSLSYNNIFTFVNGKHWLKINYAPIKDEQGSVTSIILLGYDITESVEAEEKIRLSEAKYRRLFQNMDEGMALNQIVLNENGEAVDYIVLEINQSFHRHSPLLAQQEIVGRRATDLYQMTPEYIRDWWRQHSRRTQATTADFQDGFSGRWFHIVTTPHENGRFATIFTDITEHKRAEEERQRVTQRMLDTLESISDGFFSLDQDWKITYFNSAAERLLGRQRAEVLDQNLWAAFPQLRDSIFEKTYREAMREKKSLTFETYFTTPPYVNWFAVHVYPQASGISVYFQVINDRKQAEAALRRSLEEKEMLMHELQHRVKNSLAIASNLLSLKEDDLHDEQTRAIFASTRSRLQSMSAVYEQLYRSGEIDRIDLHTYIQNLVGGLAQAYILQAGQVRIETELAEMQLDLRRTLPLGLILNELITNALKYAFPNGCGGDGAPGIIRVALEQNGAQVTLSVTDNGVGIPGQGHSSIGLGLELVNMLAQQVGGAFHLTCGAGCAARVTFHLD